MRFQIYIQYINKMQHFNNIEMYNTRNDDESVTRYYSEVPSWGEWMWAEG